MRREDRPPDLGIVELAAGIRIPWRRVTSLQEAVGVVQAACQVMGGVLVDALHLSRTGSAGTQALFEDCRRPQAQSGEDQQ